MRSAQETEIERVKDKSEISRLKAIIAADHAAKGAPASARRLEDDVAARAKAQNRVKEIEAENARMFSVAKRLQAEMREAKSVIAGTGAAARRLVDGGGGVEKRKRR